MAQQVKDTLCSCRGPRVALHPGPETPVGLHMVHTSTCRQVFILKKLTLPLPHPRSLDCSQNPKYACTDTLVLPLSTLPVCKLHCWACLLSWTCLSPIFYCCSQIPWQKQLKEGGCNWLIVPGCSPSLVGSTGQWCPWPVHACLYSAPSLSLSPRPGSSNDTAHIRMVSPPRLTQSREEQTREKASWWEEKVYSLKLYFDFPTPYTARHAQTHKCNKELNT